MSDDIIFSYKAAHVSGSDEDGWDVVLQDPEDRDNFVVIHRSRRAEDSHTVMGAVNSIFQEHIKYFIKHKLQQNEHQ